MTDYNFKNEPTFHFYRWLVETAAFDIPQLIDEAYENLENDEMYQLLEDTSRCLQNQLSELLLRELEGALPWGYEAKSESIGITWTSNDGNKYDSLVQPLSNWALSHIYFYVVAQKLLMDHGKWNPERVRPEAI